MRPLYLAAGLLLSMILALPFVAAMAPGITIWGAILFCWGIPALSFGLAYLIYRADCAWQERDDARHE